MDWLSNPWVVGLGGGVLSGLVVTFISRAAFSRRDRGEYLQKVLAANRELIYALRPGISEGHVPERDLVSSLINATARKYDVEKRDLFDPTQLAEELTKEIMDSSFISSSTKDEYYNQLEPLLSLVEPVQVAEDRDVALQSNQWSEYRSRMITVLSALLGSMTALMTLILILSDSGTLRVAQNSDFLTFLLPTIVALTTIAAGTTTRLRSTTREIGRLRRRTIELESRSLGIRPESEETHKGGPNPGAT